MSAFCSVTVFLVIVGGFTTTSDQTIQSSADFVVDVGCLPCTCTLKYQCLRADCFNKSLYEVPDNLPTSTCFLGLARNMITKINSCHFENFPNLKYLDLSDNIIEDVDEAPFRNLPFLRKLSLSGNNLTYLYRDTFTNLTHLTELNVSKCHLNGIDPRSLMPMQAIRSLDLSGNQYLGFKGIENATFGLQTSNITKLFINSIVRAYELCVAVSEQHLQYLQNTSLETIEANNNRIENFQSEALRLLPKTLKYVSVRYNRLTYAPYILYMRTMTGLTELDFGGHTTSVHDLTSMVSESTERGKGSETHVTTCRKMGSYGQQLLQQNFEEIPFFTSLVTSNISHLPIPPNLKRVRYRSAESAFVIPEIHFQENKLEYIDISYNVVAVWKGPIVGLNSLSYLDMSHNVASYVSEDFFMNMTTLKILNISDNSLERFISKDRDGRIFRNLHNLEHLDMSKHFIPKFPPYFFKGLKSLTNLNISYNNIYNLTLNFTHNKKLTILDCSYNRITWIYPQQRKQLNFLAELHNISIDLTGNPLHCHCNNIEFWEWILNSKVNFLNLRQYVCQFENATFANMTHAQEVIERVKFSCAAINNAKFIPVVIALPFVILLYILGPVFYRYRSKLRYWFYAAKIRMKASPQPETQPFDFDAFVSYADEDRGFVINTMMPKLEAEGVQLNIHHRDFIPGNAIAENIIDAVQRSRKTIILLSRNFLKSTWCQYELQMANMESVSTGRDVLLIVMLEHIQNREIPPVLLNHIQNNTYIEYPQYADDNLFWNNLCQALKL